ncbi:MAG: Gfo/Idh/MocA family oxidoreductase, partial [Pirellulaceae bacterium]|nr:Gfo/Idh/MocA family oxidoreductase [Pirellulaceae bacterium]
DFRELFDKEAKNLDSCHVTVPDHMHAPIAMTAINHKKHVYCQKPLTHAIDEARKLRLAAKRVGVVTQLGTQIHSHTAYRTCVKLIREGAIGKVESVHTWADRGWTNDGRPTQLEDPPAYVHWDLWIGVAPFQPWGKDATGQPAYHPKKWWSWMDFGTGNLGDMGCHLFDPVVKSLDLGPPLRVCAECAPPKNDTWPSAGRVEYWFPKTEYTAGPLRMTWYDGGFKLGNHPPTELARLGPGKSLPSQGSIFIGQKGCLLLPHWKIPSLLPAENFKDYPIEPAPSVDHWLSFIDACRGEGETSANFDYAGPFSETVLLGNLAKRFPNQSLEWDSDSLRCKNFPAANDHVGRTYRRGWAIEGLS